LGYNYDLFHEPMWEHAAKGYKNGTHRLISPRETLDRRETLEWLRPILPRMGITRLANVTGLDRIGIPAVMACQPNARSLAVNQGKGLDLDSAKASAAMESVEEYNAEHITLPLKFASYNEMRMRHRVVDVESLPRASDSHYHANLALLSGWLNSGLALGAGIHDITSQHADSHGAGCSGRRNDVPPKTLTKQNTI
jgi:hypothetical protein